ncbi:sialidase family protein [Blastopirellula marina]|uniref:exo-alpha-sialidase n=1 Tax=Blastopirellula marina TaxID=124 RepID=A0A2S8GMQ4_9BACT|nr:sialidase family protein [Blastopirellula marina]PQO45702.1 sialidase [Blastopirellula marina]
MTRRRAKFLTAWVAVLLVGMTAAPHAALGADLPTGLTTSFEEFRPGELTDGKDASGRWAAAANHAETHVAHHRNGKQSLRLLGGEKRSVVWTPAAVNGKIDQLDFWMERWTQRAPFDFLVEGSDGEKWTTLFHDRGKALVGSFRNQLSIPLPNGLPQQIRFTSTTPPDSGVMIDDLSIEMAVPQQVAAVTARPLIVPVLVRNSLNPVLDVCITVQGSLEPLRFSAVDLQLAGSLPVEQIERIDLIATGGLAAPNWKALSLDSPDLQLFGTQTAPSAKLQLTGDLQLVSGENHFYVSVQLADTADPAKSLAAAATSVQISGKTYAVETTAPQQNLRIGYALRNGGDDGVHTYRIPGLATTNRGTLIAVYDVRKQSGSDLPGDIDVGMSRSTDGGRSWEPMQIIFDMGSDARWRYDGVGDPAVLVDQTTGDVWVAATWSHGNRSWHGSGPGLSPTETGQLMLVRSSDDGQTWSDPINITKQVKRPEWSFLLQGPGKGITMQDGTIVFAAQYQDSPQQKRLPHSTIIFSKDHGQTWQSGTGAFDDTTEAQVVEVEPGVLMLNCRYNRQSARVVITTADMGKTWQEHPTSRRSLIEPGACMASLINVNHELRTPETDWLLFSNPDSLASRCRIMIKASNDRGLTWPEEHRLLIDEGGGAGYSCMSMIDAETLGILYEGSLSHLIFQRIPLSDVLGDDESQENPRRPRN